MDEIVMNRGMRQALLSFAKVTALGLVVSTRFAQSSNEVGNVQTMHEQIQNLKRQAESLKSNAENQFHVDQSECYKKILSGNCVEEAGVRRRKLLDEAKALERQANAESREAREIERQEKLKRQAADAPRKEKEEQERIEKYAEEERKHAARRAAEQEKRAKRDAEDAKLLPARLQKQQEKLRAQEKDIKLAEERKRKYEEDERQRAAKLAADEWERTHPKGKVSFLCAISLGNLCD